MDALQQQINELNYKLNQLYHIVEQVRQQLMGLTQKSETQAETYLDSTPLVPSPPANPKPADKNQGQFRLAMEHKDILLDDRESETLVAPEGEVILSRDLQVRRLTAQLTAAYNRIAALEEQLMACRRSSPNSSMMRVTHSAKSF
ncbi:conserved hypothetical protein [Rippkaea orientalis PCC 8801]|uniref:Uncharacterized protein n=1 Tax=Rippkaea orientalis (strain PCC 8801 / RF-1) TaxID=41431 RepID=B7JYD1_RIPO1|nr:conserved hypothetical protein [Rippkaea orientalis PCC 8801]